VLFVGADEVAVNICSLNRRSFIVLVIIVNYTKLPEVFSPLNVGIRFDGSVYLGQLDYQCPEVSKDFSSEHK